MLPFAGNLYVIWNDAPFGDPVAVVVQRVQAIDPHVTTKNALDAVAS